MTLWQKYITKMLQKIMSILNLKTLKIITLAHSSKATLHTNFENIFQN